MRVEKGELLRLMLLKELLEEEEECLEDCRKMGLEVGTLVNFCPTCKNNTLT